MFDLYRAEDLINQQEILITLIQNKMKDEYIIINKTAIQKKIEELENKMRSINRLIDRPHAMTIKCQITELKQLLSQSTPLIPEIEKSYDAGKVDEELSKMFDNPKGRYLGSLKLDI